MKKSEYQIWYTFRSFFEVFTWHCHFLFVYYSMIDEIICEECGVEIDGFFLCDDCEEELYEETDYEE